MDIDIDMTVDTYWLCCKQSKKLLTCTFKEFLFLLDNMTSSYASRAI